jgi:hypothetical protein
MVGSLVHFLGFPWIITTVFNRKGEEWVSMCERKKRVGSYDSLESDVK